MARTILELNDSEIIVARDGKVLVRSPGVAVIENDQIELGEKAARCAHLNPRNTFNRFWSNLNQDRLQISTHQARHHADLAFAHLLSLFEQAGKPDEILLAVPGSFNTEQLSLLVGLAEAGPFSLTGLVDSAVAATASAAGPGTYDHLDIHLHYSVLTTVQVGDHAERVTVKVIDGCGLVSIRDKCAAFIAELFIQQARFDPLHHARTEQALYDQIPQCLAALQTESEILVDVQFEHARHKTRLGREALVNLLAPIYERICNEIDPSHTCLLSKRIAGLPQFSERIADFQILDEQAVFTGCMQLTLSPPVQDSGVNFLTRIRAAAHPVFTTPSRPTAQQARESSVHVSHVLIGHRAYPISSTPIYLSDAGEIGLEKAPDALCSVTSNKEQASVAFENGRSAVLNGRPVSGKVNLSAGDTLRFTASALELTGIDVVSRNGA